MKSTPEERAEFMSRTNPYAKRYNKQDQTNRSITMQYKRELAPVFARMTDELERFNTTYIGTKTAAAELLKRHRRLARKAYRKLIEEDQPQHVKDMVVVGIIRDFTRDLVQIAKKERQQAQIDNITAYAQDVLARVDPHGDSAERARLMIDELKAPRGVAPTNDEMARPHLTLRRRLPAVRKALTNQLKRMWEDTRKIGTLEAEEDFHVQRKALAKKYGDACEVAYKKAVDETTRLAVRYLMTKKPGGFTDVHVKNVATVAQKKHYEHMLDFTDILAKKKIPGRINKMLRDIRRTRKRVLTPQQPKNQTPANPL